MFPLPSIANLKFYLYAGVALLIVGLGATLLILSARLDAKDAKLEGQEMALTSYQAALQATREQVGELQAIRQLDSEVLSRLDTWLDRNRLAATNSKSAQDRLKKTDEPTKAFLDTRTPDALRRLLDAEDGLAPHP